jgi:hypothetical protein
VSVTTLTERRKEDRALMARQVVDLASKHGLAAWHRPEQPGTRCTAVDLEGPHGLRLTVRFRGNSPQSAPDIYVLSWHGVTDGWRLDPGSFGDVNPYHGRKATDVTRGFTGLTRLLERRFTAVKDGSAFIRG